MFAGLYHQEHNKAKADLFKTTFYSYTTGQPIFKCTEIHDRLRFVMGNKRTEAIFNYNRQEIMSSTIVTISNIYSYWLKIWFVVHKAQASLWSKIVVDDYLLTMRDLSVDTQQGSRFSPSPVF
jgi:hypothetical protein